MFRNEHTPLYTPQNPDLFITYKDGFNMDTGNSNQPKLPEDEQCTKLSTQLISGKLVHTRNQPRFSALNSSNNVPIIHFEAHINTKHDFSIGRVFKTMSVAELKTLHTFVKLKESNF